MPRLTAVLFCLLLLTSCKEELPKIEKELIYSTLSAFLEQDSIRAYTVCSRYDIEGLPVDIQKEFFEEDSAFVQIQLQYAKTAFIEAGRLHFYRKGKSQPELSVIDTACSKGMIYRFSYPIFSKDKQIVVMGVTDDCNCLLGGWGYRVVYRKEKGVWKRVKKFDQWIS